VVGGPVSIRGGPIDHTRVSFSVDLISRNIEPAGDDFEFLALAEAIRAELVPKGEHGGRMGLVRKEEPEPIDAPCLLRARRQRPRGRAAEQRDELATAAHSITSSARARSVGGRSGPGALAGVRVVAKSDLFGC